MDDKFFKLGTIVVFSIIIPGLIITSLYYCFVNIDKSFINIEVLYLSFIWGFLSNTFGHFIGVIFRKHNKKYIGIPFNNIYLKSYKLNKDISSLMRKDSEFWFSIYTLYWNTASGILLLSVFKIYIEKYIDYPKIIILIILVILLFYLSINLLDSINDLTKDLNTKVSIDYRFSKSIFCYLNPKHIKKLSKILASIDVNKNIWHTKSQDEFKDLIRNWLDNPINICVVIEEGEDLVGFGRLDFYKHEKRKHVAIIGPVAINPKFQNNGYATLLIKELEKIALSLKIKRIEASFPANSIIIQKVFKRNDFEFECVHEQSFMGDDGNIIDMEQWRKFII